MEAGGRSEAAGKDHAPVIVHSDWFETAKRLKELADGADEPLRKPRTEEAGDDVDDFKIALRPTAAAAGTATLNAGPDGAGFDKCVEGRYGQGGAGRDFCG